MYTFDQVLWLTKQCKYRVLKPDRILMNGRSLGSLGKLAGRLRKMPKDKFWASLPNLPEDIRASIIAIASYQDTWTERQQAEAPPVEEVPEEYYTIGKFND